MDELASDKEFLQKITAEAQEDAAWYEKTEKELLILLEDSKRVGNLSAIPKIQALLEEVSGARKIVSAGFENFKG